MLDKLESDLNEFDFSPFENMVHTRQAASTKNKVHIIPIKRPLPHDKRVLNNIVSDTTLALPTPHTEEEFCENTIKSIKHLLDNPGESTCFFCPEDLLDYRDFPSADFVKFEVVNIQDRNKVLEDIFNEISSYQITSLETSDFSEFLYRTLFSYILSENINRNDIQKIQTKENKLYIPYEDLDGLDSALRDYYLESIGVDSINAFENLPENAKENVVACNLFKKHNFSGAEVAGTEFSKIIQLDSWVKKALRVSAFEFLRRGESSRRTLEEIFSGLNLNREKAEKIDRAFKDISGEGSNFNTKKPAESGKSLIGVLSALSVNSDITELKEEISASRTYFSDEVNRFDQYSVEARNEVSERLYEFLLRISEIALVQSYPKYQKLLSGEEWVRVYKENIKAVEEAKYREFMYIPGIERALREVREQEDLTSEVRDIENMEASYQELPRFIEKWSNFVSNELDDQNSEMVKEALINKYDEFSEWIVNNYNELETEGGYEHISDLLEGEEDKIEIVLVIDSFGYTDYKLMQEYDALESKPDSEDIVFSNIPSYTPSAMSTLLTGLTPDKTGIYEWNVKKDDEIINLGNSPNLEFVSQATDREFQLIQNQTLSESGITQFVKQTSPGVRLSNLSFDKKDLNSVKENFTKEIDNLFRLRKDVEEGRKPQEAKEAVRDKYVLYLESFDNFLHSRISLLEFPNYYRTLGDFIDEMVENLSKKAEKIDEQVDLVVSADHGKLTKHEIKIINQSRSYSFNNDLLLDSGFEFKQMIGIDFDSVVQKDKEGKKLLKIDDGGEESDQIALAKNMYSFDGISDEEISSALYKNDFMLSGSKFIYGFLEGSETDMDSSEIEVPGTDLSLPSGGNSIFDRPDVGLLSRYSPKNQDRKHHGYHGGTSLSEMCGAKLTFSDI